MDSEKVIKRDNEYVLHTYNRNPVVLEKGHGLYAEGPEGQKYLDFTSGIGVNSLGYCDLDWAEAVSQQAHKLQHTSNLYYTAPCGKLAKKLCKRTGMSKVFFGNSGAEANEGAIKAARKYSFDHYGKGRDVVITLVNSFHGRTIATLTATGQEVFHNYFGPFNEGFLYAPAGDIEALEELVDRTTCAVMLELIQGEGGVMALDPDYVQAVRALCDEKDLVLIVDEVQTGVGRTGTFLCCEHYNLKPDVVTLAKGLGGGLPIGAVLMNEKVAEGMGPGTHGSTFGGNPVFKINPEKKAPKMPSKPIHCDREALMNKMTMTKINCITASLYLRRNHLVNLGINQTNAAQYTVTFKAKRAQKEIPSTC